MNNREQIEKLSLVGMPNLETILYLLKRTEHLPGVNAEVGVYRGGTALLIASNSSKRLHCVDTFDGLPEPLFGVDLHKAGEFAASYEDVKALLDPYPNAFVHRGLFPHCLTPDDLIRSPWFSFTYLDVDLYQSTKDCLEFFYHRMVRGGILVTDDYGWKDTPGVKLAVDDFMADKPEQMKGANMAYFVKQ